MSCMSLGIPRIGAPRRIFQTARDITFLYETGREAGSPSAEYRIIPTDGRKHDPILSQDIYYLGYTVGRWDGDTLVLDSIAFNDQTWLSRGGFFHSDQMRVIERLTRQGNTLRYEVTVEDPVVLAEPWVMPAQTLQLATVQDAGLLPERPYCKEYDQEQASTQIRH